jgi:GTP:adenosylcobinamide-phosphate guanylyltransferase/thiamine kinase-like enzyme
MQCDYIIVQAGGKGTRLEYLTKNKNKALVPIENLPIIFHLFRKYPDKRFIIIGDYKIDVLKKYLASFAKVKYLVVDARGNKGTCAGLSKAIDIIPEKEAFMLIWSDLILPKDFALPDEVGNYVGLSKDFECRWHYENNRLEEIASRESGVAGLFIFKEKSVIEDVPQSGEFVRWLQETKTAFNVIDLYHVKEYGLLEEYNKLVSQRCRPFNSITIEGDRLIKQGIDEQGRSLAVREKAWYKTVTELGFKRIPKIYSFDPFVMEKIDGKNIFEYDLTFAEKKNVLGKIVSCLKELHSYGSQEADYFSTNEAYFSKTFDRLNKIRDLVPFANKPEININGRKCRNIFYYQDELEGILAEYQPETFKFLHGDCTFSNMLLKNGEEPILIDPRGYFGFTEMYGDEIYDWAKLYYSIKGNYDQFNLKRFQLDISDTGVDIAINSNKWEDMEDSFFEFIDAADTADAADATKMRRDIKLIHAIIWLSLTTYAWEDYDSICGAFYNGLYHLEEAL